MANVKFDTNSRVFLSNDGTGSGNTVFGKNAGASIDSGTNNNVFIGENVADATLVDAIENVAIGYGALSALTQGDKNITIGYSAGESITEGYQNVLIGDRTGDLITDAKNCVIIGSGAGTSSITDAASGTIAIGSQALEDLTSGDQNIAIGYQSLKGVRTGGQNIAIGYEAMEDSDNGENHNIAIGTEVLKSANSDNLSANIAIGTRAMGSVDSGEGVANCVAIGYQALRNAEDEADGTVAIGKEALTALTTGIECIAIGQNALANITTSTGMIAIGDDAGKDCDSTGSTPDGCVYIGASCGQNLDDGTRNTAVGFEAMTGNSENGNTPNYSVAVGWKALTAITDGDRNVTIGAESGTNLESGSYNVLVGYGTQASAADSENAVVIGYDISGGGNEVTIGKASNVLTNNFTSGSSWAQSSDERLKTDIKDDNLGLDFIKELKTKTFKWKPSNEVPKELTEHYNEVNQKNTDVVMHGMIAQEVKAALDKSGVDTFGGWSERADGSQSISREMFVIPLIKAVQELSAKVEELESKLK